MQARRMAHRYVHSFDYGLPSSTLGAIAPITGCVPAPAIYAAAVSVDAIAVGTPAASVDCCTLLCVGGH